MQLGFEGVMEQQKSNHLDLLNRQEVAEENIVGIVSGVAQVTADGIDRVSVEVANVGAKIDNVEIEILNESNEVKAGLIHIAETGIEVLNRNNEKILIALGNVENKIEETTNELTCKVNENMLKEEERYNKIREEMKEDNERTRNEMRMMINDNNDRQERIMKETFGIHVASLKEEIEKLRKLISEEKSERSSSTRNIRDEIVVISDRMNAMQKELQSNLMRSTLRENAMLGRLDNFKDELYELRKTVGIQLSFFQKLEEKFKESNNRTGNIIGICDSHVMQLSSTINGLFGMMEDLKRTLASLENG
jgi:hypothetical protein